MTRKLTLDPCHWAPPRPFLKVRIAGGAQQISFLASLVWLIMTSDIKLSRSDNQPWGFRLSGGADFPFPLTVVRVTMGGLAHKAGLQAGDIVIELNGEPLQQVTHGDAYNRLVSAGNNLQLTVVRDLIHKVAK